MNPYRQRTLPMLLNLLRERAPAGRTLDFGSGDGWFARQMRGSGLIDEVVPVDVQARKNSFVQPQLYDGKRLPFADRSFDLVYSVDVLHHCPDPAASLRDLVRCSNRLVLLKDHTWRTRLGKFTLALLDEIGNRKFGIPCLYRYQRRWEWFDVIQSEGFRLVQSTHPAECHTGLLGRMTNALQFAALWERIS
jgi:SAM-dependent methyltransferase